jgi:hypothetical protein
MKIKTKTKMEVEIKMRQTKPKTIQEPPVQKKFEILSAVAYPSTASAICGLRIESQNKVTEIIRRAQQIIPAFPMSC